MKNLFKYYLFLYLTIFVTITCANASSMEINCDPIPIKSNEEITCIVHGNASSGRITSFEFTYDSNEITLKSITGLNGFTISDNTSKTIKGYTIYPKSQSTLDLAKFTFVLKKGNNLNVKFTNKKITTKTPKTDNSNYMFIGDSYFDPIDGDWNSLDNYNNYQGTPDLLGVNLEAISGKTIEYYTNEIKTSQIDIPSNITDVVIYLGTNNIGTRQSPSTAENYMRELIDIIHTKNSQAKIHILTLFVVENKIPELNNYYQNIADSISYVDLIDTRENLILSDGRIKNRYIDQYHYHVAPEYYSLWIENLIRILNLDGYPTTTNISDTSLNNVNNQTNLNLKSLSINNTSIALKDGTYTYHVKVNNSISKVSLNATLNDSNAQFVTSYGPRDITLKEGSNTAILKVQSADAKNVSTYTIIIEREQSNNNSNNENSNSDNDNSNNDNNPQIEEIPDNNKENEESNQEKIPDNNIEIPNPDSNIVINQFNEKEEVVQDTKTKNNNFIIIGVIITIVIILSVLIYILFKFKKSRK